MLDHRMRLSSRRACRSTRNRIGRGCGPVVAELDLAFAGIGFDVVQPFEEIEIPREAPVFAVGDRFQADRFLLLDDVFDLAILDLALTPRRDLAALALAPRLFERRQSAAGCRRDRRGTAAWHAACSTPHFIGDFDDHPQASPIARLRPAHCPPRSRRSRIAATGKADRALHISSPRRCGA